MPLFKKQQKDINLIPEAKKNVKLERYKVITTIVVLAAIGLLIVVGLAAGSLNFSESNKSKKISDELGENLTEWQKLASVAEKANDLKIKSVQISDVIASNDVFSDGLDKIKKKVPDEVTLTRLEISSSNSLSLQATSKKPAKFLQFTKEIEKEKDFFGEVKITSIIKSTEDYTLNLDLKVIQ